MKKTIARLLCLLVVLSMTACGGQTDEDQSITSAEQTEADSPNLTESEPQDTEKIAQSTQAEEETAFDTGWASNEFEAILPELPFTGWTTSQEGSSTYKMELSGLNTSPATNPPDSGEPDGADKDKLIAYLNSLPGYGFTVEETGVGYMWKATDASGNTAEFMCADGGCWITIRKAS